MSAVFETDLPHLKALHRGKVRDIYDVDEQHMLIVTTDRLSAFDVVLPQPIPGKGEVLTRLTRYWLEHLTDGIATQRAAMPVEAALPDPRDRALVGDRAMVVKKLEPLPVEAIVRRYIIGSGWKDYQKTGNVCGIELPAGLQMADKLPEPLFTPSTKADIGDHDENIDFAATVELLGHELAQQVRDVSLQLYEEAADYARERGIIIADTKFEFGLDDDGTLTLIDEALTPDSSRFWPADDYQPGTSPVSFDKQFVRDYLETLDWDKTAPGPELPAEIIEKTAQKYQQAKTLLTA